MVAVSRTHNIVLLFIFYLYKKLSYISEKKKRKNNTEKGCTGRHTHNPRTGGAVSRTYEGALSWNGTYGPRNTTVREKKLRWKQKKTNMNRTLFIGWTKFWFDGRNFSSLVLGVGVYRKGNSTKGSTELQNKAKQASGPRTLLHRA